MDRQNADQLDCSQRFSDAMYLMCTRSWFYAVVSVLITAVIVLQAMLLPDVASDINDHIEAVEIGVDVQNTNPESPPKTVQEMLDECNFMKPITATTCGLLGSAVVGRFAWQYHKKTLTCIDKVLHCLFLMMMLSILIVALLTSWNTIADAQNTTNLLVGLLEASLGVCAIFVVINCYTGSSSIDDENAQNLIPADENQGVADQNNWENVLGNDGPDSDQNPVAEPDDQQDIRPVAPVVRPDAIVVEDLHSVNPISEVEQQIEHQPWSPTTPTYSGSENEADGTGNNIRRRVLEQLHKL